MDDKHIDCECIIPEAEARRRGMQYTVNGRGCVISAKHEFPIIIDQLHHRQIIDDSQHFFGTQFITMHRTFTDDVRYKGNRFYEAPDTEPAPINAIPIDPWDYLHICRAITNRRDQAILGDAIDEHSDQVTLNRLISMPQRVSHAFSELQRHISAFWKAKKDCIESGCQGCTGKCVRRENSSCAIRAVVAD